jgi:hypothetical protein
VNGKSCQVTTPKYLFFLKTNRTFIIVDVTIVTTPAVLEIGQLVVKLLQNSVVQLLGHIVQLKNTR